VTDAHFARRSGALVVNSQLLLYSSVQVQAGEGGSREIIWKKIKINKN